MRGTSVRETSEAETSRFAQLGDLSGRKPIGIITPVQVREDYIFRHTATPELFEVGKSKAGAALEFVEHEDIGPVLRGHERVVAAGRRRAAARQHADGCGENEQQGASFHWIHLSLCFLSRRESGVKRFIM